MAALARRGREQLSHAPTHRCKRKTGGAAFLPYFRFQHLASFIFAKMMMLRNRWRNLQTVTQFAVWDFFRQVPDVPEAVANSLLLVGEGVSCHRCRRGGRGREEDSDTGLPILQGHLQLATPSPRLPSPARRTRSDSSD